MSSISRRSFFKAAGVLGAGALSASALASGPHRLGIASASAQPRILGTAIDYSGGVPSGREVKAAGHVGAIRYVSHPRPGETWMKGKPVSLKETTDFAANRLWTASVYQFGRAQTADWLRGQQGAFTHAPQAIELHQAAGGPKGVPIYAAIDDNPTRIQYTAQIRAYLTAFENELRDAGYTLGIYGNYSTIDWAINDGLGTHFWLHNWGSGGKIHPRANIHQVKLNAADVDGVRVDLNHIYTADWGQWQPGKAHSTPAATAATKSEKPRPQITPTEDKPTSGGGSSGSSDTLENSSINQLVTEMEALLRAR